MRHARTHGQRYGVKADKIAVLGFSAGGRLADNAVVPADNSIWMFRALRKQGAAAELHIFPHGSHGLGLAEADPQISQ